MSRIKSCLLPPLCSGESAAKAEELFFSFLSNMPLKFEGSCSLNREYSHLSLDKGDVLWMSGLDRAITRNHVLLSYFVMIEGMNGLLLRAGSGTKPTWLGLTADVSWLIIIFFKCI